VNEEIPLKDSSVTAIETTALATVKMTPIRGLLILVAVLFVLTAYLVIDSALGVTNGWVGYLFLLYWSIVEQMKLTRVPQSVVGALVGLAISYGLQTLPFLMGTWGWAIVAVALLLLVYFSIMGWWPIAVNGMTMLFLTVSTIPWIQAGTSISGLFLPFAIGVVYFVAIGWLVQFLLRRAGGKSVA
jgi:hypothetical protein